MSENRELATITLAVNEAGELSAKVVEPAEPKLQKKFNVKAKKNETVVVKPDEGFDGLSEVSVAPLRLRARYVSPSNVNQEIRAGEGFDGLDLVQIDAIYLQDKTVTPTDRVQMVMADEGYNGLGYVTINPAPVNAEKALNVGVLQPEGLSNWNPVSLQYETNNTLIAVKLPHCVKIENFALRSCVELTDLYLPINDVVIVDNGGDNDYQFGGSPRHITLHVPVNQINAYLSDENWQKTLNGGLVAQGFTFSVVAI